MAVSLELYPQLTWQTIRSACEAVLASSRQNDPVGYSWFVNAGNGYSGTPLVILKVLPDLAPDIWGAPDAKFARFGLFEDPDLPHRILPRGLGVTGPKSVGRPLDAAGRPTGEIDYGKPGLLSVTLACGSCHTGRVTTPGGGIVLDGAPNTQFDARKWRQAFSDTWLRFLSPDQIGTTETPGPTTVRLQEIIDSKPPGFFADGLPAIPPPMVAQVDMSQRRLVKGRLPAILTQIAAGIAVRNKAVQLQTQPGSSYGHGAQSPGLAGFSAGQSDGSGDLLADRLALVAAVRGAAVDSAALPPFATVTDIPSVWNQASRSVGQWDGSVLFPFWRNIAAQLPIVGDPSQVDLHNTHIVADFLEGLPAPPYPFDIDLGRAARGETLFLENCAGCHRPRNDRQFHELQTDFNRAQVLDGPRAKLFLDAFRAACHERGFAFANSAGQLVRPCVAPADQILRDTTQATSQGYIASPLDGVWARAPYLHNGSVPTLSHLLKPWTRPRSFMRGVIDYDQERVGFVWDAESFDAYAGKAPTLGLHETWRDGWSNAGHDKDLTIDGRTYRLNWEQPAHAEELRDLLEYLKTK